MTLFLITFILFCVLLVLCMDMGDGPWDGPGGLS